jgi:hypothetical protein
MLFILMQPEQLDRLDDEMAAEITGIISVWMERILTAVYEALEPVFEYFRAICSAVAELIRKFILMLRRVVLYERLMMRWHLPKRFARWIALHVPECFVPRYTPVAWSLVLRRCT